MFCVLTTLSAVPSPIVSIIRSPNLTSFYTTHTLDMVCTARSHPSSAVDTPTTIATLLLDPNDRPLETNSSRLRVYGESEEDISNLTASYTVHYTLLMLEDMSVQLVWCLMHLVYSSYPVILSMFPLHSISVCKIFRQY